MAKTVTVKDVKGYFGYTDSKEFTKEWKEMSVEDKDEIKLEIAKATE